jgi:hypothetical protein
LIAGERLLFFSMLENIPETKLLLYQLSLQITVTNNALVKVRYYSVQNRVFRCPRLSHSLPEDEGNMLTAICQLQELFTGIHIRLSKSLVFY